jgi:hypothetical protein
MVFGVLIFASPFAFGETFRHFTPIAACVLGALLVLSGIVAASTREPRRSLIINAPGLVAVITFIAALVLGFSGNWDHVIPLVRTRVAWTAGVMAIATVLAGATLRLSPKD